MKYFFDNSISCRIPKMLCALDVDAHALRDEFPEDISDIDLFDHLSGRDITYITADMRQLTREKEAIALRRCGVRALFFGPFFGKLGGWDQAVWIIRHWKRIDGFSCGIAKGVVAEIRQGGAAIILP